MSSERPRTATNGSEARGATANSSPRDGRAPADEVFDAIAAGDERCLDALLASDPRLAAARTLQGVSAVLTARYSGHQELVDRLLLAEPVLDVFDAAAVGDVDRVRGLIEKFPQLARSTSVDGFSALHLASFFGHPKVVEILLARGADPDTVATNGTQLRPLNSAAAAGHNSIAHLLLDHGANVEVRQTGGYTPLHSAAHNGDRSMTELLLERGADPGATADDGRSTVELASEHPEVIDLL